MNCRLSSSSLNRSQIFSYSCSPSVASYRGQFKLTIGCYFYTKIVVARPGKKYQEPLSCAFHANASYVDIVFLKAQAKFQKAKPRLCLRKVEIPNSNEIAVFF